MLFTEWRFLWFFLLVLAVHWGLRSSRLRKLWLLGVSYVFYGAWDWRFLSLILLSTAVDFLCGLAMARRPDRPSRKPWLYVSLAVNLGILGFFKYFGFFVDSATVLASQLGLELGPTTLNIVLPVGISFYTFQTLSYSLDVYRGRLTAVHDAFDFALFVAFFPQLVAGPIVRATEFLPQLAKPRLFADVAVRPALTLFLVGFFKKACLADGIAGVVDPVFADPVSYSTASTWLTVALYHVQIYCDFSGYSDMAIATAALLGYRLPLNFYFPYFASGIGEFWRRWHISLTTWMRDYIYLPQVDHRSSEARRIRAIFVTMGLCGLWHGAGWGFVAFGLLHAAYLVIEELWKRSSWHAGPLGSVSAALSWPALMLAVLLTWPVFRIDSVPDTRVVFATLLGLRSGGPETIDLTTVWVLVGSTLVHWAAYRRILSARLAALPDWGFALLYGFTWSLVLPWVATETVPFIYFQF